MKKIYQYTMILLAGVLGACGSMSVDDPYVEALPADFNPQEYLALHPILSAMQYRDFVADYNNKQTTVDKDSRAADKAAFAANMDAIGYIYTHPFMEAHTPEQWAQLVANLSLPDTVPEYKAAQGEVDNLVSRYNLVGVADDIAMLSSVQIDYFLISQQFTAFGRDHGWAYRLCHADEAANTPRSALPIAKQQENIIIIEDTFKPDTGFYCRDAAGIDRLIQ
ncbi:MAG: hypothetical protein IJM92_01975 [Fibrobacter sp.]|uniref:hypothetical protein n=1 Tax=Fibrobacter sp. TaxID=35828 RepID=UPI0025C686E5|nr:hypothetical protein [Fibrobacter sp.]MBQ7078440.1 hypothetical protein [Fibrobacter sp.]